LRASHIKPWAASNYEEKLDGYNGLLLSPHVDHLFDRGFISFQDSGGILIAKDLNPSVLEQWAIHPGENVGKFKGKQCEYLEYHREVVFQG
jgi:predicted restriction endonuclease